MRRAGAEGAQGRAARSDRGVYPGSFNPLTRAHLHIAEAARDRHDLREVHLAVSRRPIDKERVDLPLFRHRLEVLEQAVTTRSWLHLVVTEGRLIADIAHGYGVVIMGADKWEQVNDVRYYASAAARDAAVGRLPTPAIAPRPPHPAPPQHLLDLPPHIEAVSSTRARDGDHTMMAPEAVAFDRLSGAWSDPDRYREWAGDQIPRT